MVAGLEEKGKREREGVLAEKRVSFWADKNILEQGGGDGCVIL